MTFHCKEQQFHNAFLIGKEHQLTHMLVAKQMKSCLFAIYKIMGFFFQRKAYNTINSLLSCSQVEDVSEDLIY